MFTGQTSGTLTVIIYIVIIAALYYVLLILPQRRRVQAHNSIIDNFRPNTEVVTIGGIFGTIKSIQEEDTLMLEVSPGVEIKVSKDAVAAFVATPPAQETPAEPPTETPTEQHE
jgi:preprotein translocase subunit YajC